MTMLLAMSMTETLSESVFVTYANGSTCAADVAISETIANTRILARMIVPSALTELWP